MRWNCSARFSARISAWTKSATPTCPPWSRGVGNKRSRGGAKRQCHPPRSIVLWSNRSASCSSEPGRYGAASSRASRSGVSTASRNRWLTGALRPDYEPWFWFASATGLRLAETLIKWENVNWEAKRITTTGKGGKPVGTAITPDVAAILEPLKDHHPEAVFTYVCRKPRAGRRKGQRLPITYAGAKSEWQAHRKRAGVKGFRFHDVRHDMATKLLRSAKGNIKLVSKALNHSDIKTTARYAHVMDDEVADALQKLSKSRNKSRIAATKQSQAIENKA